MSTESPCRLRIGREQYQGTARLESEHIDFAGQTKFRFRFSEIRNPGAIDGHLAFDFHGNRVRMDLGGRTDRWLNTILHPKALIDKLGVRTGNRIRILNYENPILLQQLAEKKVVLIEKSGTDQCDMIIFCAERPTELRRLSSFKEDIVPDGSIWVVIPKSSRTISQGNVLAAAREAGMVGDKVVSCSETHSGHRVVMPPDKRPRSAAAVPTRPRRTTPVKISTTPPPRRAARR